MISLISSVAEINVHLPRMPNTPFRSCLFVSITNELLEIITVAHMLTPEVFLEKKSDGFFVVVRLLVFAQDIVNS